MATCFLSYSSSYEHLKTPIKNLLEAVGFEKVDVFDEPHLNIGPLEEIRRRINEVDAVVILYGPAHRPEQPDMPGDTCAAEWVAFEAQCASSYGKIVGIIPHEGTSIPMGQRGQQTYPHFDFWDDRSFIENVHHIVRYIREVRRKADPLPGPEPYFYKSAAYRNRIQGASRMTDCVTHEVRVRAPGWWSRFPHAIDTCGDYTAAATLGEGGPDVEAYVVPESDGHKVTIEPDNARRDERTFPYHVVVDPPLQCGQALKYRRVFTMPNRFPLTRAELDARAKEPGFPSAFAPGYYGDRFEVPDEVGLVTFAIELPSKVKVEDARVHVVHGPTGLANDDEAKRCAGFLKWWDDDSGYHIIELKLPSPIINNLYYVLYKPGD